MSLDKSTLTIVILSADQTGSDRAMEPVSSVTDKRTIGGRLHIRSNRSIMAIKLDHNAHGTV